MWIPKHFLNDSPWSNLEQNNYIRFQWCKACNFRIWLSSSRKVSWHHNCISQHSNVHDVTIAKLLIEVMQWWMYWPWPIIEMIRYANDTTITYCQTNILTIISKQSDLKWNTIGLDNYSQEPDIHAAIESSTSVLGARVASDTATCRLTQPPFPREAGSVCKLPLRCDSTFSANSHMRT